MKKIILAAMVALFGGIHQANAQSSMLATLNHNGEVSTFYGTTALRQANSKAAHGDVITLSSGTFVSSNITKAIVLRGSGMDVDSVAKSLPTIITGDFSISIADSVKQRLTIEGIQHNDKILYSEVKNPTFLKCRLNEMTYTSGYSLTNATFIHCNIKNSFRLAPNSSASLFNTIIEDPSCSSGTSSIFEFNNCHIRIIGQSLSDIDNSAFNNCVISVSSSYSNNYISGSCSSYNSVCTSSLDIFKYMTNDTNHNANSYDEVYKKGSFYELTDAAKQKYRGTDGKDVGIRGGLLPFDATPTNPQITKCNVAAKSTADGKLSVDIEVKAAE